MTDNIQTIQEQLKNGDLNSNPTLCAEYRAVLSGEYSFYAGLLEDIIVHRAKNWAAMRSNHKSDTSTQREWESTPDGVNFVGLEIKLKRIEKLMSGLSSLIKSAEGQSRNQY